MFLLCISRKEISKRKRNDLLFPLFTVSFRNKKGPLLLFLAKEWIFNKVYIKKTHNRLTIYFKEIKLVFLLYLILCSNISFNCFQLVDIVVLTNTKRKEMSFTNRKTPLDFNKTTKPPPKIRKICNIHLIKLFNKKLTVIIFPFSSFQIGLHIARKKHFFKERKLHSQSSSERRVVIQNPKLLRHLFLIILYP